ncbi:hypothetical protein ASPCADRAFT_205017 [Aspergillus carbonarius ITEM 5010]|uniref:Uncharacterized protein n=1 Tax=Aspergillus carbonarius (strain ITEM 5010) TaxID=602072 RepID=A0A1R3RTD6_ASPC5|nr:hypothetical protein ASPCADRAFT_205017 [Aspergillus carbonarius ITEM 5010]
MPRLILSSWTLNGLVVANSAARSDPQCSKTNQGESLGYTREARDVFIRYILRAFAHI